MLPIDAQLETFAVALDDARALASAGGSLDLTGLDGIAEELCAAVMALPAAQRRLAAERLADIGARLDALAGTLATAAAPAGEGPGSRHARAGRAYRGGGNEPAS